MNRNTQQVAACVGVDITVSLNPGYLIKKIKEFNPVLAFCIGSAFMKNQNGAGFTFLRDTSFNLEIFLTCHLSLRTKKKETQRWNVLKKKKKKDQREKLGRGDGKKKFWTQPCFWARHLDSHSFDNF